MIIKLKILTGLSSEVVRMREHRTTYQTNRNIKAFALYTWLKNKTEAGTIHHFDKQLKTLLEGSNISRSSFYRYLNVCEDLKLLKRFKGNLKLSSYASIMEALYITDKKFTWINYDTKKNKIDQILNVLEISENKAKQSKAIEVKLSKNPIITNAFNLFWISKGQPNLKFNLANLQLTQKIIFESGAAERIYKPLMYIVNPEFSRCSNTIASAHNYKSARLVTYYKRKLVKAGLISVLHSTAPICLYNKDKQPGIERGKNENSNYCPFIPKTKQKIWFKPQQIIIKHTLFTTQ